MAKVRLLRQQLEDFNKKSEAANAAYLDRYGAYQTQFDAYAAATNDYNARVAAFNAAGARAGDVFQNEQGTLSQYDKNGNPNPFVLFGGNVLGGNVLGGTDESGGTTQYGEPYKTANGMWVYDVNYTMPTGEYKTDAVGNSIPVTKTTTSTNPINVTAYHPGTAPVAPAEPGVPEEIRAPNLTASNIRELQNPGLDQAGMQRAANRGILGKSELAGMERSRTSAFADPEDPNNLKEAGVLARTLGGQL